MSEESLSSARRNKFYSRPVWKSCLHTRPARVHDAYFEYSRLRSIIYSSLDSRQQL
jgi:hypothetical protein